MNDSLPHSIRDAMRLMQSGDLTAATAAIQEGLRGTATSAPRSAVQAVPQASQALDGEFRILNERIVDTPVPRSSTEARMRDDALPAVGQFQTRTFSCAAGTRDYKLFVPCSYRGQPMPLIVMLHGCTQTPDEFARGTRMNDLAEIQGCLVAYPAQAQAHNCSKCARPSFSTMLSRAARTVAVRAPPARNAISPIGDPGPISATMPVRPSTVTSKRPEMA